MRMLATVQHSQLGPGHEPKRWTPTQRDACQWARVHRITASGQAATRFGVWSPKSAHCARTPSTSWRDSDALVAA